MKNRVFNNYGFFTHAKQHVTTIHKQQGASPMNVVRQV
ncbi:hypothetical protein IMSAGC014_00144 [Bacteroidaceae bacterium]|nr:hypothetical protein IMSAGC014_00144 [Bacteroidaceae bacterium]